MPNIAGKAYAMNVVTPIKPWMTLINKFIFWLAGTRYFRKNLLGLQTLSLIHYARWAIVRPRDFPRLSSDQPAEDIRYTYMFFFSNFNGSWAQYVDSFSSAIPYGLDLLWYRNVGWPKSVPTQPFHDYITHNQVWTNHYYNAYPMASSNDVKSARVVKDRLRSFAAETADLAPEAFANAYDQLLLELQEHLGPMQPTPIVSLAAAAVYQRRLDENQAREHATRRGPGAPATV
ncbi:MAG: hypothetical protein MJE66_25255 [Proteobacteria bacterium]|nr:hypothetical protein [Pseudomonadota bacterium]